MSRAGAGVFAVTAPAVVGLLFVTGGERLWVRTLGYSLLAYATYLLVRDGNRFAQGAA